MNLSLVERIANAVLYEGFLLWPYRRSALKNQRPFSFGGLSPAALAKTDPSRLTCECLLRGTPSSEIEVTVRFLQAVENGAGAWDEAIERQLGFGPFWLEELMLGLALPFDLPGAVVENAPWRLRRMRLTGVCRLRIDCLHDDIMKLRIEVENTTPAAVDAPAEPLTFRACHVVGALRGASFLSLSEAPDELRSQCVNDRTWPVLVGDRQKRDMVLCSPIILSDFPEVAPESPGETFDATENDELLSLNIMALPEDERLAMAETGAHARALLERTLALDAGDMERLHGTIRARRSGNGPLAPGDRVRLKPRRRADIFDLVLKDRIGRIVSIERDFEDRTYVTVAVEDDPGRDLADGKTVGHRFFFDVDEVELLQEHA